MKWLTENSFQILLRQLTRAFLGRRVFWCFGDFVLFSCLILKHTHRDAHHINNFINYFTMILSKPHWKYGLTEQVKPTPGPVQMFMLWGGCRTTRLNWRLGHQGAIVSIGLHKIRFYHVCWCWVRLLVFIPQWFTPMWRSTFLAFVLAEVIVYNYLKTSPSSLRLKWPWCEDSPRP